MSKKDDQILDLTAENVGLLEKTNSLSEQVIVLSINVVDLALSNNQWRRENIILATSLKELADTSTDLVEALEATVKRLTEERDAAVTSARDWRHFADAERALRLRYKDAAEQLAVVVESSRLIVRVTNEEATRLSEEATTILKQL